MASNPPGDCCLKTTFQEGVATGKHVDLYGLNTYVSGEKSDKIIVIFTDVFGNKYNNVLLNADRFAAAGYYVLIPDIIFGDVAELGVTDFAEYLAKHSSEVTRPIVEGFLTKLKADIDYKFLGAIGYCFGAKYVVQQLAKDTDIVTVGAVAHPSFVSIEEVAAISKPILISAAETDSIFPAELRHLTEDKLKEIGATYQLDLFSGVEHGFAVRGDVSIPAVAYAKEKAFRDHLYWFDFHSKSL